jgi:hypothetical protein
MAEDDDGIWADGSYDNFVAYWTISVISPDERQIKLKYRHDDGLKIWAYGSLVVSESSWDGGSEKTSSAFTLHEGANRLLFKLRENSGNNRFAVKLVDESGNEMSDITYSFDAGGLPAVGVIVISSPKTGDAFTVGDEITFKWTADPDKTQTGVGIDLSFDGGITYHQITASVIKPGDTKYYSGNQGTYVWTIPEHVVDGAEQIPTISNDCMVKIHAPYETDTPQDVVGPISIKAGATGIQTPGARAAKPGLYVRSNAGDVKKVMVYMPGKYRLEICDMKGRIIATRTGRNSGLFTFDSHALPSGMTIMRLTGAANQFTAAVPVY